MAAERPCGVSWIPFIAGCCAVGAVLGIAAGEYLTRRQAKTRSTS